jgi:hypothetical protein
MWASLVSVKEGRNFTAHWYGLPDIVSSKTVQIECRHSPARKILLSVAINQLLQLVGGLEFQDQACVYPFNPFTGRQPHVLEGMGKTQL